MFEDLAKVFWDNDSLPLGSFETRPCRSTLGGTSVSYPELVDLGISVDHTQLNLDYEHISKLLPDTYIKDRIPFLTHNWESLQPYYRWLNVSGGSYKMLALREVGSVEPRANVPQYTKSLIADGFGCPTFKQHYAITSPGYFLRHHIDYRNFLKLGYRVSIPVNAPSILAFTIDGLRERRYKLEVGHAYFFNVGRFHRAQNLEAGERVNIILQLTDDTLIKSAIDAGRTVVPFGEFDVPVGQEPSMSIAELGAY